MGTENGEFSALFARAMGPLTNIRPFSYQTRLATVGTRLPSALTVPTGAGKTAAVLLAWLWRRRTMPEVTPRRLVYALPMRVLVEQTHDVAKRLLSNLGALYADGSKDPSAVQVAVVMGGEVDEDWWLQPERDTVVIGTIDMLLSRALNRGFGASRYRWPIEFGLLNSDVLWVFDEVQLMGVSLHTSLQLDAFRQQLGTCGTTHTLWVSATLDPSWLRTVDHPQPAPEQILTLTEKDLEESRVLSTRMNARKLLRQLRIGGRRPGGRDAWEKAVAREVLRLHQPQTTTLVVLNTVERARSLYAAVRKTLEGSSESPEVRLIHSQFRPMERSRLHAWLTSAAGGDGPGRIVISTQVVEAGVDVSARTLITELAPWPSIIQRLGRCNRYGEDEDAAAYWIDVDVRREASPYDQQDLEAARLHLLGLKGADASPRFVSSLEPPAYPGGRSVPQVLRRRDLVGLFDTTPDLSGQDTDVSRFIREGADLDILVFWREWGSGQPPADLAAPRRDELCPVPVYRFVEFLDKTKRAAWVWDPLGISVGQERGKGQRGGKGRWRPLRQSEIRPGLTVLLSASEGGYDTSLGWSPDSRQPVPPLPESGLKDQPAMDSAEADADTTRPGRWITLERHTRDVLAELDALLGQLGQIGLDKETLGALRKAAAFHDVGKAHEEFQRPILDAAPPDKQKHSYVWAKAPQIGERRRIPFRHELASALAYLQTAQSGSDGSTAEVDDLVAFLIAAHHGKVRLGIRSLLSETRPSSRNRRFAQGIWDQDELPSVSIPGLVELPGIRLDLSVMEIGRPDETNSAPRISWTERMLALRDSPSLGPFRLAFLEALLRVADIRASIQERGQGEEGT